MSEKIELLYFPGDDRAEDASVVVRDVADAALARANELSGSDYSFDWQSEVEDAKLTVGLRLWLRMRSDFDVEVLNEKNGKDLDVLNLLVDGSLADIQAKYPKVQESDLDFVRDTANSLKSLNVLVPTGGVLDRIKKAGYAYKGATGTLSGKGTPSSINVFIRKALKSDACVRDFRNVAPRTHESVDVNMRVFVGPEGVTSDSPHLEGTDYTDAKIITKKSRAIVEKAFAYAKDNGINKVYVAQKGNILKESDNAFVTFGRQLSEETGIEMEYIIFDNFLQRITKNPNWFEVIVTTEFYGRDFLVPVADAMLTEKERTNFGEDVGQFFRFEGQNADFTQLPIDTRCYRQNNEGFYIGEGKSTDTESINFRRITREMSENVIRYAFDDTLARNKKSIFVLYSPFLKGDELFTKVGREIAKESKYNSLNIQFMTIPSYCWFTINRPLLVESVVGTNLTMDFLTDAEASKIGGIGMMPSFNYTISTGLMISEPGHGTAPDLQPDQINPGASIWAMCALLERMGDDQTGRLNDDKKKTLAKAGQLLADATFNFYKAGKDLTGDLGGSGSTTGVGTGIKAHLSKLN